MAKREERKRPLEIVACGLIAIAVSESCGGTTSLGKTGEGGAAGAGGARADSGTDETGGTSPAGGRRAMGSGGRISGMGGRTTGGVFGTGGRATGGVFGTGGRAAVDASASGGADAGGASPFDAGSDPGRNRVLPGHVCERLTEIQCAGESHCCPTPRPLDVCLRERLDRCQSLGYFDALSMSPIVTYDLSHAEPAFAEFEKRASTCDLDILKWMFSDAGFRNVARGTIPPGGDCTPRMDAGLVGIDYLGACREPETNSCVYTTPVGDVWKCSPRSDVGGPCYTDYNCTDGLGCNYDFGAARTCEQRRPDGAPCMIFLQCQSMYCDAGSCKPATPEKVYCWM